MDACYDRRIIVAMKILSLVTLVIMLGTMFASLFHMSMDMDTMATGGDCMYMSHAETWCPMSVADHIGAWQSVFQAIAPTIILLLITASAFALVATVAPHFITPRPSTIQILQRQLRERTYLFSYRPLQELFARGILHPKLF